MNNTVLQWYTYCSEYVSNVWHEAGYDQNPLVLSFDWIQIDNTRLDVFFTGVYPFAPGHATPICLDSNKTLQNDTVHDDVCSRLTLGGFGENLISSSNTRLKVRINQRINAPSTIMTHEYQMNSLVIKRLFISSSYIDNKELISILDGSSRKNIFDGTIQLFVSNCEPGYTWVANICMGCNQGEFKAGSGSYKCTACASGHYSQQKSSFCHACPHYAVQTAVYSPSPQCTNNGLVCYFGTACSCNAGHGQPTQSDRCQVCARGTSASGGGGWPIKYNACLLCQNGKYQPYDGNSYCLDCEAGKYTKGDSMDHFLTCLLCATGKYKSQTGDGECVGCEAGKYQDSEGSSNCKLCPKGSYNGPAETSYFSCRSCNIGKFKQNPGPGICSDCEEGKYSNLAGSEVCNLCPDNTEGLSRGLAKCTCLPNTYEITSRIPSQPCSACPDGLVTQDGKGGIELSSCQCAAGFYRSTATSGSCMECPTGRTSAWGMIGNMKDVCSCDESKGYYATRFGCALCEGGLELNENIPEDCQDMSCLCPACGKGKYRATGYEGSCVDCEYGKFSSSDGSLKCNNCTGTISQNNDECVLPEIISPAVLDPPKIMHHSTIVVFDHFEQNTLVKTILGSVDLSDWKSGDTVRIYENGTRNLNPVVFVYNDAKWSPININPIHNRDNVYVFNTPRSENYTPHYMSILWQNAPNVELLSTYVQHINMQPHFLRKQFGVLSSDDILAQNTANSHYTPFEVRVINNEPIYTTQIMYG